MVSTANQTKNIIISFKNVYKTFEKQPLLNDISFEISKGERLSIIGPGGCGKTTILKLLVGLISPDKGTILLNGLNMVNASIDEKQQMFKKVGVAFQQGALFDFMTIEENLKFAIQNMTDMNTDEMNSQINFLLSAVKLANTHKLYPHELSGGMQRRVGIARALSTSPDIALFDEPTSGLDPVTSSIILKMIQETLNSTQTAIILTSSVELAIRFAPRIILINDGQVVEDGSWSKILIHGHPWAQKFLSARLIGIDKEYAQELALPQKFIDKYFS